MAVVLCRIAAVAFAENSGEPTELRTLRVQFQSALEASAVSTEAKLTALNYAYRDNLDALQKQFSAAANLDGALAVKAERKRVEEKQPTTETDKKTMPFPLLSLRTKYEQAITPILQARQSREDAILQKFASDLQTLQVELTKRDELDQALAVKQERERVLSNLSKTPAGTTAAADPRLAMFQKTFFEKLSKGIKNPQKTAAVGPTKEGKDFIDLPKGPAFLVGFDFQHGDWFGSHTVSALRPIYQSPSGRVRGEKYGNPDGEMTAVEAREGYAVGGLVMSVPHAHVHGIKVIFCKIDWFNQKLDTRDSYTSDLFGIVLKNDERRLDSGGHPVIGIHGHGTDWIAGLGFLLGP